jgi:hypothetical protein
MLMGGVSSSSISAYFLSAGAGGAAIGLMSAKPSFSCAADSVYAIDGFSVADSV